MALGKIKDSQQNYSLVDSELKNLEILNDALMNSVDKETDEWRSLFMLKSH